MNVGDIKAFVSEQKPVVTEQKSVEDPVKAMKKQLQQEGLRQAVEFQQSQNASVSMSTSQTSIGLKVYSSSMESQVTVDGQKGKFGKETDETKEKEASLFDFEAVAKNVMRFVGGVIQGAADSGADADKLNGLFSQARDGVARGIALAQRDIGGLMNDEISTGIDRSQSLIENRLTDLENRLLDKASDSSAHAVENELNAGIANAASASLLIRTRDGDEVTLSFESSQSYQYQRQLNSNEVVSGEIGSASEQPVDSTRYSENYSFFEKQGISFSLKGELDDGELTAIADLVGSVNDLADTFYSGDIDSAFEQALEIGYDDEELVGYALQMNRVQQTEVVRTYGEIQHYKEGSESGTHGDEARPIAQYLDKMLSVFESAVDKLASGEDFNSLINGLINEMKDVQVPDLVSAINRFHTFNQRLLEAVPEQQKTQPIKTPSAEQ
ncbi:DUF5610 domain-containing protein [Aestuariibacter sp. A3R04]|uniref:DUF5610 domain-containing protein n=1 Tax=Aestuariibacter sp. A3R04 TaxID=2841571 RepID=UPI001C086C6A|nr:DUF5610 domain-containing protein [Aestuariibacter sp. A3R04]MBU3022012.1 DUF5610 domain-containing protein [Aestuariibacter sp. A3R04]